MATTNGISGEEALQLAETLREKFLEDLSDDPDVDPRDVSRVEQSLPYVAQFIKHNRGNVTNAYSHMVACMKWRKSFGANDIHYEEIDESLWKMGLAYNRGVDRNDNHIVILNIRLHKKDSKKAVMIQRWITFCFETLTRLHPDKQVCMIFNMQGAGLSNMDMDLVRFIVNCFKIYFPNMLALLLVYNMPWVLQAAWKIVQSWLSDGAISKIKFVTDETIVEFIDRDQLLTSFGGTDTWTFDYITEKHLMIDQIRQIWGDQALPESLRLPPDETVFTSITQNGAEEAMDLDEEWDAEEEEEVESREGRRKVRFSANLPPVRQSRYGPQDGATPRPPVSHDNRMLIKGSGAGSGFRERHVHSLLHKGGVSRGRQTGSEGREEDPSPKLSRRHSEPASVTSGPLLISPMELVFAGRRDADIPCSLTLRNTSNTPLAYKIKTTAPHRYKVRPNLALLEARSVTECQVLLVRGNSVSSVPQDKFLVQTYVFDTLDQIPDQEHLQGFWRALPEGSLRELRMRCRWVREPPSTPTPSKPTGPAPRDTLSAGRGLTTPTAAPPLSLEAKAAQRLEAKVEAVLASNRALLRGLEQLQRLSYLLLALVILLAALSLYF